MNKNVQNKENLIFGLIILVIKKIHNKFANVIILMTILATVSSYIILNKKKLTFKDLCEEYA